MAETMELAARLRAALKWPEDEAELIAEVERLSAPVDGLETTRVEQGWGLPWDLKLLLLKIGHRWITYDEAERLSSWVQAARRDIDRLQAEVAKVRESLAAVISQAAADLASATAGREAAERAVREEIEWAETDERVLYPDNEVIKRLYAVLDALLAAPKGDTDV